MAQLEATAIEAIRPDASREEQAHKALARLVRNIYETSGLQAAQLGRRFPAVAHPGRGVRGPAVCCCETSTIQHWIGSGDPAGLMKDVTVLYRTRPIFADHPVLAPQHPIAQA